MKNTYYPPPNQGNGFRDGVADTYWLAGHC